MSTQSTSTRRRGWNDENATVRQSYWNGWADRDEEDRRRWARYAERLRRVAGHPPADVLAERRGEHERAVRIREFWALTGLHDPQPAATPDPAGRARLIARCRASWGLPAAGQEAG